MKKQIFALVLLLSLSATQVKASNDMIKAIPSAVALAYCLNQATNWPTTPEAANTPGIWTTAGKPLGMTGRGTLMVTNVGLGLLTLGLLAPATREAAVSAGTFGALFLCIQSALGAKQTESPVDTETTTKVTILGGVLGLIYKFNPTFHNFANGLISRR